MTLENNLYGLRRNEWSPEPSITIPDKPYDSEGYHSAASLIMSRPKETLLGLGNPAVHHCLVSIALPGFPRKSILHRFLHKALYFPQRHSLPIVIFVPDPPFSPQLTVHLSSKDSAFVSFVHPSIYREKTETIATEQKNGSLASQSRLRVVSGRVVQIPQGMRDAKL